MDSTAERYDGLRAKAVVVNSGGSCAVRIWPVWSEYLALLLLLVMCFFTIRLAMVAFMNPFGQWNWIEWLVLIFVTVVCGAMVWGQAQRVALTEVRASREGIVVRRRFFGVARTLEVKSGALENVCWHGKKDLTGWPWHSFLQVALPNGKEIMLANELSVMDERFGNRVMGLLAEVTGWKSEVKRVYMEPPDPSSWT